MVKKTRQVSFALFRPVPLFAIRPPSHDTGARQYDELIKCADAAEHFRKEMLRIYSVVEEHLSGKYRAGVSRDYLAGNGRGKYSIADMGIWPRAQAYRSLGFADEDMGANFPCLVSWIEKVARREAVMRGIDGAKYDSEDNPSLVLRTS